MPVSFLEINFWIFLYPLLGAAIGWIIHSIVMKRVLKQYIPRKKKEIGQKIARWASQELSDSINLEKLIADPQNLQRILPLVDQQVDIFLNQKLQTEMPMVGMLAGTKTMEKLKEVFMRELQALFPQVIGEFVKNSGASLNIEEKIAARLTDIPDPALETIIRTNLSLELRSFRFIGAFTGFVTGIMLALLTILTG